MVLYKELLTFVLVSLIAATKGAIPGTFFWRPRFGLDLAIPSTEPPIAAYQPNKKNIEAGIVVLLDGYDTLTSLLALISGIQFALDNETMNPANGLYYIGVYRWALRTLLLFPHWLRGNFHEALGVWYNRFKYMDAQVPNWIKKMLPWVTEESWDKENKYLIKFRKESESAFSQFYRFPSKTFHNFNSFLPDTIEDFIFSSMERDGAFSQGNTREVSGTQNTRQTTPANAAVTTETATTTAATTVTPNPARTGKIKQLRLKLKKN